MFSEHRKRLLNSSLLFGISAVIALIIVNIFVTQSSSIAQRKATERVMRSLDVLEHLDATATHIAGAEAAQRTFILTDDAYFLEPYTVAIRGVESSIATLKAFTVDNAEQTAYMAQLQVLIQERLGQMNTVLEVSRRQGLMAAREALIRTGYRASLTAIHTLIATLKGSESSELAKALASSAASYRRAFLVNIAAGVCGLLALATLVFLIDKNLRARDAIAAEVERQRETLRVTLASIGDGVITTDNFGRVLYLNGEAELLTGWKTEAAAGRPLEEVFRILNEGTRQPVENPAARALREGVVGLAFHTVLIGKDGVERPIDDIAAPIRDAEGGIAGVVLIFRNVTEERAASNQLQLLATELSEADGRKNEFLAMLAHEIRNPLAAIRNSVAILKLAGRDPQASAAAQGAIYRQMEHLVRLVEDLLDVSRISRGKLALQRLRIDLRPAVEQALEACRPTCESSGQILDVRLPETPLYVQGDAARITQAVGNLLSNASKFSPRGGRIQLVVGTEGPSVFVSVRDDGIGIAAEEMPRLFEMFSQIDTSLERAQGGLGIGLSLVKQLIEMHGGRVEARSDGLGRGSEFVLYFPLIMAAEEATFKLSAAPAVAAAVAVESGKSAPAPAPAAQAARRILVVDDNVDSADSLAALLRLHGHETQVAHDGLAALELALRAVPDVVILDIGLPGLNGYEVARRLRLSPQGRTMRLIALTGWGQDADRKLSSDAGFDEHMVKPVDHDQLQALLARPWIPDTRSA